MCCQIATTTLRFIIIWAWPLIFIDPWFYDYVQETIKIVKYRSLIIFGNLNGRIRIS